jgi:hypothetical protein
MSKYFIALQNFGLDIYFAKNNKFNKKKHTLAACLKKPGPSCELGPKGKDAASPQLLGCRTL